MWAIKGVQSKVVQNDEQQSQILGAYLLSVKPSNKPELKGCNHQQLRISAVDLQSLN